MGIEDFERYPLTFGPSPVHRLPRLSEHLGGPSIWAKREDCSCGVAYGGNKVRKLEYLVPDALAQGADVRMVDEGFGIGFKSSWEQAVEDVRAAGGRPYAIPAGASDHALGGLGFAAWAREVQQQEAQLGVFFDPVIVCAVTGSTQAGMIAGFAAQDRPRRVIGIDASARVKETRDQVERIARRTAEQIGVPRELGDDEITVLEGWAGDAYGIPVQSTVDAIRLSGRLEGMILDPVYEGKSMAGVVDLVREGQIGRDSHVVYAHLGGQPALNAYSGIF